MALPNIPVWLKVAAGSVYGFVTRGVIGASYTWTLSALGKRQGAGPADAARQGPGALGRDAGPSCPGDPGSGSETETV